LVKNILINKLLNKSILKKSPKKAFLIRIALGFHLLVALFNIWHHKL
jgi:hypothetical protein